MYKLVLLRHAESVWNLENRFTGWTDVELSPNGIEDAKKAGIKLRENNYTFDIAFVSPLKRSKQTLEYCLLEMGLFNKIDVVEDYRLNERHYGALQGLNKDETKAKYGEEQVHLWRRSYYTRPPELEYTDPRFPGNDSKYKDVPLRDLPLTESLYDVYKRVIPYYEDYILPVMKSGKRVLICSHGNSFRALIKYLDNISDIDIENLEVKTGVPIVYEFDDDFKVIKHYYL